MFSSLLVFKLTYWVKVYGELRFSFYRRSWQLVCWLVRLGGNLLRGTVVGKLTDSKDKVLKKRVFVLLCWLNTIFFLNKLPLEHSFVRLMRLLNYKAAKLQSKIKDRFHSCDRWLCKKGNFFSRRLTVQFCTQIRHLRNENATGAKRRPTIVCGMVTGDEPVSFWSIFFLSLLTVQKVFANPTQIPYRFLSGDCGRHDGQ